MDVYEVQPEQRIQLQRQQRQYQQQQLLQFEYCVPAHEFKPCHLMYIDNFDFIALRNKKGIT